MDRIEIEGLYYRRNKTQKGCKRVKNFFLMKNTYKTKTTWTGCFSMEMDFP
jgi:hypothetical protein